jgi:hypothetical protein
MTNKTKIILLSSMAAVSGAFYYSKKIQLPDGSEINPIKRGVGGALIGVMFASFIIVTYEFFKK